MSTEKNKESSKYCGSNRPYDYIGKTRILERVYPNDTKLSYLTNLDDTGYDGIRRILRPKNLRVSTGAKVTDFRYAYDREHHRKSVRRFHELTPAGKTKGETYGYDSAYRLVNWDEGTIVKSGTTTIPVRGGGFSVSPLISSVTATVTVLQGGGYPIGSFGLDLEGQSTDSQFFGLDGVGNFLQMRRQDIMVNNEVSPHNEYSLWADVQQSYDANGNLLDDGAFLYQYDYLNRLRIVKRKSDGAQIASYDYDAMNRRVLRATTAASPTGAETVRYLYDGWHAIEERDSLGNVTKQFVYGARLDEILKMDQYSGGSISATYYYHCDALGSVVALTDETGSIVERVKYSPYGQPYFLEADNDYLLDAGGAFLASSTVSNPLLFTAARYDAETGIRTSSQLTDWTGNYYLRNRYLDSDRGRFITRDPIGIWGDEINLGGGYSYCGNDPVNWRDPLGLDSWIAYGLNQIAGALGYSTQMVPPRDMPTGANGNPLAGATDPKPGGGGTIMINQNQDPIGMDLTIAHESIHAILIELFGADAFPEGMDEALAALLGELPVTFEYLLAAGLIDDPMISDYIRNAVLEEWKRNEEEAKKKRKKVKPCGSPDPGETND